MPNESISYQKSGYFSTLINDYLDQKSSIEAFYNRFPSVENFKEQIAEKQTNFSAANRAVLVSALEKQYVNLNTSSLTQQNIEALKVNNTFTVTTGHQLNLFSGPLYFLYKIISTIKLASELKAAYPAYNFVPIYWMATEDHDFEEINYFNFKGKKFRWNRESSGPVGRLSTEGLSEFYQIFEQELGSSTNAQYLKKLFKNSYLQHKTLTEATLYFANELFGQYGLIVLNGDNKDLKQLFIPQIKDELLNRTAQKEVLKTINKLQNYNIQVNPRNINLFYIENEVRERIVFENGKYHIKNTSLNFSKEEILSLLYTDPEKFSPNVILRPLYQEVILPNLCYIGGGGEIAYWLELKSYFEAVNITFPILQIRNSVLLATNKQQNKATKLGLNWYDLFLKQSELINKKTATLSEFHIDLNLLKDQLKKQFLELYEIAKKTDPSFLGALKAQEQRQTKGLEKLEKRLLKAQKIKKKDVLSRISELQNELFPNNSLQERQLNFSEFYLERGNTLIPLLMENLQPLKQEFNIIIL